MTKDVATAKKTAVKKAAKPAVKAALPATIEQVVRTGLQQYAAPVMELSARYTGVVYDVKEKKGMEDARKARAEIRELRYTVQKHRDAVVSELAGASKLIKSETESVIEPLLQVENPIHELIVAEEERIEIAKQEAAAKEAARIKVMEDQIARIGSLRAQAAGADAETIRGISTELGGMDFTDFDEVFQLAAEDERTRALNAVQRALSERIELDRLQVEQAARQIELDKKQAAQQAENEARARLSALQSDTMQAASEHSTDPDWFARALDRLDNLKPAEAFAPLTVEQVEPVINSVRTMLQNLATMAKTAADNAKLLQEVREREEQARADEAAQRAADAKREADEAAARKAKEDADAIAMATLESAAGEALVLLNELGQSEHLTTRKLSAALHRTA